MNYYDSSSKSIYNSITKTMIKMKIEINNTTYGFENLYDLNEINFTVNAEIFEEIKRGWDYLENKQNQTIQMSIRPKLIEFSTDDEDFDEAVYYVLINVKGDRTIYLECCDSLITKYFSDSITELELIESFN